MEVESDDEELGDTVAHSIPGFEIIQICKLEMVCISESDAGTSLGLSHLLCKFGGEMHQKEMANAKQTMLNGFWNCTSQMLQWSQNTVCHTSCCAYFSFCIGKWLVQLVCIMSKCTVLARL